MSGIIANSSAPQSQCCGPQGTGKPDQHTPQIKRWCVGNKCMAWRWHKTEPGQEYGYCGLAGNPMYSGIKVQAG